MFDQKQVAMSGPDSFKAKKKYLDDMTQWANGGMANYLKAQYSQPKVQYAGADGAPVEKVGTTGPDGLPEQEPSMLLKDLDQDAIKKLLGQ